MKTRSHCHTLFGSLYTNHSLTHSHVANLSSMDSACGCYLLPPDPLPPNTPTIEKTH